MARNFTITTPAETVRPGANGRADMVFTVTNTRTTPDRALVRLCPAGTTRGGWLSVTGESEREFAPGAVRQFTVAAVVPRGTPPGRNPFRLDVLSAQRGGEEREEGPTVTADPAPKLRKLYGCDNSGFDPAAGLDTRSAMNYGIFTGSGVHPYFKLQANRTSLTSDVWQWTELTGYVDGKRMIDHHSINSDTNTLPNLYLGGTGEVDGEHWFADIAEVIVYSRTLEDAERQKVEDYLAAKYGVTLNR